MAGIVDEIWGVIGRPLSRQRQIDVRSFAHFLDNLVDALAHPISYVAERETISQIEFSMSRMAGKKIDGVPKIIHFVYLSEETYNFPYYALVALKSAAYHNPGWTLLFHYHREPQGEHWNAAKKIVRLNQIPFFCRYGLAKLSHNAHRADIVRLLALKHIGGAYLDLDTLTVKSFEDLRQAQFVMAAQAEPGGGRGGLCNAAMLAAPGSRFVKKWLRHYCYFHSQGRDYLWDFHSVKLPEMLARKSPDSIQVLDENVFFYPLWTDLHRILLAEDSAPYMKSLERSYLFHLWNGQQEVLITRISEEFVQTSAAAYAQFARPSLMQTTPSPDIPT
ncbi:glycosyltransferase [Aestuariivirga sp.]|uniref:glycosyltransferase n=1 Tax=Aestuariivirga sp. TaxID=2650926 RepID=UPI003BACE83D